MVPRLNNFVSPPVSSRGAANFTLPSRRLAPIYVPDSQYTYLDRIHSFALPRLHRVSVLISNFFFCFLLTK